MANKIKGVTFLVWIDWFDDLDDMLKHCLQVIEYFPAAFCIHNRDTYDRDEPRRGIHKGDPKKIHAHFCVNGNLTKKQREILEDMLKMPSPLYVQKVHRGEEMFEYLTHSDFSSEKKNKVVYSDEELYIGETFDKTEFCAIVEDQLLLRVYDAIDEYDFTEICQLVDFARKSDDKKFFEYVQGGINHFNTYLTSKRHSSIKEHSFIKKDPERSETITEFDSDSITCIDYRDLKNAIDLDISKSVFDTRGKRWCKCTKCGCYGIVDNFAIYGGRDHTHGICYMCKDLPEEAPEKKELVISEELKKIDAESIAALNKFLG